MSENNENPADGLALIEAQERLVLDLRQKLKTSHPDALAENLEIAVGNALRTLGASADPRKLEEVARHHLGER